MSEPISIDLLLQAIAPPVVISLRYLNAHVEVHTFIRVAWMKSKVIDPCLLDPSRAGISIVEIKVFIVIVILYCAADS